MQGENRQHSMLMTANGVAAALLFMCVMLSSVTEAYAQRFMVMELNCENVFDCRHDSLKHDNDYTPEGTLRWTPKKYWRKLDNIARVIVSSVYDGGTMDELPALVGLCEVENDTTMVDLTNRSLLRNAGYRYVMTHSQDLRGIDVALLYQPSRFSLCDTRCYSVQRNKNHTPTRDILYAKGVTTLLDTLHVFVVHAPSRRGGERETREYRRVVAERLMQGIDSVCASVPASKVLVMGDFNDYCGDAALRFLCGEDEDRGHGLVLHDVSCSARGLHNDAGGTYRHQGEWRSLDHILVSASLLINVVRCYVHDPDFILEEDTKYGGKHPRRSFKGIFFDEDGYSDHLPLIIELSK